VHRLDRGTSGVMVVARTDRAHRSLSKQFHDREIGKVYLALVWGAMKPGEILSKPIGRDPRHRQKMSTRARRSRTALTRIEQVEPLGGVSLVHVAIGTGRTHQIRVHFQHIRHPLVGDTVYRRGTRHGIAFPRQALHATELSLVHPASGRTMTWRAELPADMKQLLKKLRGA
jgi:23S rRNA pseudouridine1911/1915/1917 synthase